MNSSLKSQISRRVFSALCLCAFMPSSSFALDPQSCTVTNIRQEADGYISSYEYFQNQTLLFTNCVAFSDSSGSVRQDLTGVAVIVKLGNSTSCSTNVATAQVATNGTWWLTLTLPTNNAAPTVVVQLTNSATVYTYPSKILKTRPSL